MYNVYRVHQGRHNEDGNVYTEDGLKYPNLMHAWRKMWVVILVGGVIGGVVDGFGFNVLIQ